jgi:hypothetical protein
MGDEVWMKMMNQISLHRRSCGCVEWGKRRHTGRCLLCFIPDQIQTFDQYVDVLVQARNQWQAHIQYECCFMGHIASAITASNLLAYVLKNDSVSSALLQIGSQESWWLIMSGWTWSSRSPHCMFSMRTNLDSMQPIKFLATHSLSSILKPPLTRIIRFSSPAIPLSIKESLNR